PCRAIPLTDATIKLNRTDRLGRGPFADRLAARDLNKLALGEGRHSAGSPPAAAPAARDDEPPGSGSLQAIAPHPIFRPHLGRVSKASGTSMSTVVNAPVLDTATIFY